MLTSKKTFLVRKPQVFRPAHRLQQAALKWSTKLIFAKTFHLHRHEIPSLCSL